MKVIPINNSQTKDVEQRKEEILKAIDDFREQVEAGEISEFITISTRTDGSLQLHIGCFEVVAAIGMFEIGKQLVMSDFGIE